MSQSPFEPNSYRRRIPPGAEQEEQEEQNLYADLSRRPNAYVPRAKTIKSVVKNWSIRRNISAETTALMTSQQWVAAVGETLAAYTRPGEVRRNVLNVIVDSPLVMQELMMQQRSILKSLQESLPDHGIKSLRFRAR